MWIHRQRFFSLLHNTENYKPYIFLFLCAFVIIVNISYIESFNTYIFIGNIKVDIILFQQLKGSCLNEY